MNVLARNHWKHRAFVVALTTTFLSGCGGAGAPGSNLAAADVAVAPDQNARKPHPAPPTTTPTTTTPTTTTPTTTTPVASATAVPVSPLSNATRCLQAASTVDGAGVITADCNGTTLQKWDFINGRVQLANGQCLNIQSGNAYDGAQPNVTACSDSVSQKWIVQGDHIKYGAANLCLNTPGGNTAVGTMMSVWTCGTANNNQRWVLGQSTATTTTSTTTTVTPSSTTSDRYLHAEGRKLKDRLGREAVLKGPNIGGWLVSEAWMNGQSDNGGRWALEQLEARFGVTQAATLMNAWYDSWITLKDLDKIQQSGFTAMRVPFGYRNLQDANGNWKRDAAGYIDFSRLDWIVNEAAKRNLYVILDFHIWKTQREKYSMISEITPEGDAARTQAAAIWTEVAKHFKGNGTIAAFDLINEPTGSYGDTLQRKLYEAVRAQDPERIVANESSYYGNYSDPYWKNVMWSTHYPAVVGTDPATMLSQWEASQGITAHPEIQVPIYIGEMKAPTDNVAGAAALVAAMNNRGYHWSVWTYKGVNIGGWAGFVYYGNVSYNLASDSFDSIRTKWTTGLTSWQDPAAPVNSYLNNWWFDGFR